MKSHKHYKEYCKSNYSKIENYELAKADNFVGWHCHHKLETHCPLTGMIKPLDKILSSSSLKSLDMYYNRPPEELIFMPPKDHHSLHFKLSSQNRQISEDTRHKLSISHKGKGHDSKWRKTVSEKLKGRKLTKNHCSKISESLKGKKLSDDHKKSISEKLLGRKLSSSTKNKMSIYRKNCKWYTNGKINKFSPIQPEGFYLGKTKH